MHLQPQPVKDAFFSRGQAQAGVEVGAGVAEVGDGIRPGITSAESVEVKWMKTESPASSMTLLAD